MDELPRSEFLDRLEAAIARATRRERLSARFLTVCLLVTIACMTAWVLNGEVGDIYIYDTYFIGVFGLTQFLPWAVALCYGVLGAAALLHFAVFRRQAQQLRRQKCLALLVELEEAVRRRAVKSP